MKQLATLKLLGFVTLLITITFPAFTMEQLAKRFNYLNPKKIIQLYKENKTKVSTQSENVRFYAK